MDSNPWIYKENYFGQKTVMYKKPAEKETHPPILLNNKVFDIGTVAFSLLLGKPSDMLEFYIYYANSKENTKVQISASRLKITTTDKGESSVNYSGRLEIKYYQWTQFYFGATDSELSCFYFNAAKGINVPCFERQVIRSARPNEFKLGNLHIILYLFIGFRARGTEIAIDDIIIDLISPESMMKDDEDEKKGQNEMMED